MRYENFLKFYRENHRSKVENVNPELSLFLIQLFQSTINILFYWVHELHLMFLLTKPSRDVYRQVESFDELISLSALVESWIIFLKTASNMSAFCTNCVYLCFSSMFWNQNPECSTNRQFNELIIFSHICLHFPLYKSGMTLSGWFVPREPGSLARRKFWWTNEISQEQEKKLVNMSGFPNILLNFV